MTESKSPLSVYRASIKRADKFIQQQKTQISSLKTTIESQKETIDEQYHTISTSNIWNSKLKDEIESLKAITEIAVNALKEAELLYTGRASFMHIESIIAEIEKLQNNSHGYQI